MIWKCAVLLVLHFKFTVYELSSQNSRHLFANTLKILKILHLLPVLNDIPLSQLFENSGCCCDLQERYIIYIIYIYI